MLFLGICFIAAVVGFIRSPLVGFALMCLGCSVFLGLALPHATGGAFVGILGWTILFSAGAVAVLVYRHRRRLPRRSRA
jgi:hypothetical protein